MNAVAKHEVGVGMRPIHYPQFLRGEVAPARWVEVNAEKYLVATDDDAHLQVLELVREQMPVVLHGTSMSLGSADGFNDGYVTRLAELAAMIEPASISDHLCWSGYGGKHLHDLLPMPLTEESIDVIVPNIIAVQDRLRRPILVENLSTYFECSFAEMPEWQFISEVVRRAGCELLLDINNVYVSCTNHGWDAYELLRNIPHDRVRQIHLAGHFDRGDLLIDTHSELVSDPVWELFAWYVEQFGAAPSMIEWDSKIPPWAELAGELAKITRILEHAQGQRCA